MYNIYFLYFLIFIFGASIASFICVYAERGNVSGNSICANCLKRLKFFELIPVFSFLFLKGKCSSCKSIISKKLFFSELALGIWFLSSFFYFLHISGGKIFFVLSLILGSFFLLLVLEDYQKMEVSAKFVYLFLAIGILGAIFKFIDTNNYREIFIPILIISPFWIIYFVDKRYIGQADPYIYTGLSLFFGTQYTISLFLYSVWLGAFYGIFYLSFVNKKFERGIRIPFLPIIFVASLLILIFNFHIIKVADILFIYENF